MSRRWLRTLVLVALASTAWLAPPGAHAHRLAPSALSIDETDTDRFAVTWKTPRIVARGARVEPVLPDRCAPDEDARVEAVETAWVHRFSMHCPGGLVGETISVRGLAESGTDALLNLGFQDGRALRFILTAGDPAETIPERESATTVLVDYGRLGVEHLLGGLDHVLFVLGLLFLVGGGRRLVGAITAFTVGHSLTLAMAVFGFQPLPQIVVEIAIALSIVVLAVELVRPANAPQSLLVRRPWIMSFSFGLLHGLGFAGALAALGLPPHAIPLALFAFNVGIEIGQLGIVLVALPFAWSWARAADAESGPGRWLRELPATAIGSLGAFWCIERSVEALLG